MSNQKLIKFMEEREKEYRKKRKQAEKENNKILGEYYHGHIHEIEALLFILRVG